MRVPGRGLKGKKRKGNLMSIIVLIKNMFWKKMMIKQNWPAPW